jgi:hypothetical protein
MESIAYQKILTVDRQAFMAKAIEVSESLQIHPSWLMIAIRIESRFNRKALNKVSNAVGLIQWIPRYVYTLLGMPNNPKRIVAHIQAMTGIEQLELIKKFLAPYRGKMTDQYQTYLAIFSPVALGKSSSYVIGQRNDPGHKGKAYEWNKYLDQKFGNRDGKITLYDIKKFVDAHTPANISLSINPKKPAANDVRKICQCCNRPF